MCKLNIFDPVQNYENLNQQLNLRRNKLNNLRKQGKTFTNNFKRNVISNQLFLQYGEKNNETLKTLNIQVSLAGRMINRRIMGKASFVILQDSGGTIQLYLSSKNLSDSFYNEHFKKWDLGDILGVHGRLFKTKTGELTINCNEIILLTKALRPIPNKFHGIVDKQIRYRQRYLDLITNKNSFNLFKTRSQIITEIRQFLNKEDFIEVETPILQSLPGGATARPFITYHNALDMNLYLRIAPELYLKQLIIGGFEKIFEINRNFRNEGLSAHHNPEFTMMELYIAYADYHDVMLLTQNLLNTITNHVLGTNIIQYGNLKLDFSKNFVKMTMKEAICHYNKQILSKHLDDKMQAITCAKNIGIHIDQKWGLGRIQTEIFEKTTEKHLLQPTFITSYPIEVSPLARRNDNNPFFADRFELFIGGYEIGNGFSELNDYEDQANRLIEQATIKNSGDNESMFYDEDYIIALEHGLPPTAGLGIGIDRLVMLLTNSHFIRDVILFPTMRLKI